MRRHRCLRKKTSNSTETTKETMSFMISITVLVVTALLISHGSASESLSPPYTCTTTTTLCQPGENIVHSTATSPSFSQQGRDGKQGPRGIRGEKGERGDPCHCDVADQEEVLQLRHELKNMENQYQEMKKNLGNLSALSRMYPESCIEYKVIQQQLGNDEDNSNVTIYPHKSIGSLSFNFTANCSSEDQDSWTVIQRRIDGSVNFYRGWSSYVDGFGDERREFWIGLKSLHELTASKNYKLRIEMRNWEGESRYAEYSTFQVGDEASKFSLTISGYSGTAGDSMAPHNGMKFSTFESDNDAYGGNCAELYHGAWWYRFCHHSNLNGEYKLTSSSPNQRGLIWYHWMGYGFSLPYVEMKIKEI